MNNFKAIISAFRESHRIEKRLLPVSVIIAVVSAVMPFVNIWFSSKIIDLLDMKADGKTLFFYIAVAVSINLVMFFLNGYLADANGNLLNLLYFREHKIIASKLYSTEFRTLDDSGFKELIHKHAEAQKRSGSAFTQLSWMLRDFISGLLTVAISFVMVFPLLRIGLQTTGNSFFEKPVFLLSIFAAIAVMVVIILIAATRMNKAWFASAEEYSRLDRIFYYIIELFNEYKSGKEIRLYKEQELIEKTATRKLLNEGETIMKKASMHTAKSSSFIAILGAVVGFGIYLFIGIKGWYGLFGIGSLVLYCGSFMQIINGIMKMATTFGKTAEMIPLINYYFEIVSTKDEIEYGDKELEPSQAFEFEFRNVSFKYPGSDNYALENINVKIHNGEHLAVVGRNGSGKTTFIKLLCRFYDVTEGEILINGINIKEYSKESLMKLYSVIFQDFKTFSIPVCENVTASESCDTGRLYKAFDEANVKERILKMKNKENTYIYKTLSSDGVEISGGEAQKLALARALYKDAPVVILDEPTAALDPVAENEIYSRFNSFVNNKTAVYISHRLSSCSFCDRIVVFDGGAVLQTGTHEELLKDKNGKYYKLWSAQAQYYLN